MSLDSRFLYDLGVSFTDDTLGSTGIAGKGTLLLSPTGDLTFVGGKSKLLTQLARALMNEQVNLPLNAQGVAPREIKTLVTLILRSFRQTQISQLNAINPDFVGYSIYRRGGPIGFTGDTSDTFTKVSRDPITHIFTDVGLENGIAYAYGFTQVLKDGTESPMVEQLSLIPSQFLSKQTVVIGSYIVGVPTNKRVTIYANTNRLYRQSELLDDITQILVYRDSAEPRRFAVEVSLTNVLGSKLSLAIGRQNVI